MLDLPMRVYNALRRNNVRTVGDVLSLSEHDFLRMRNVGEGSLRDLRMRLEAHGFDMTQPFEPGPESAAAEWMGRQLDVLSTDKRCDPKGILDSKDYSTVERRRYAWSMYRWAIGGFESSEYPRKGEKGWAWEVHAMPGSLELHLEGLNRVAHDELDPA